MAKHAVEAVDLTKMFGDFTAVDRVSFTVERGTIFGFLGPNGAGKTTLFRMISGQEKPDSGSFKIGETVRLAYVDQNRDVLDPDKTIWEIISGGDDTIQLGKRQVNSRAYVARFNFSGTDQQKKCSMLSGGERNRVHLARMLKEEANVLLLDEPTNDIDVNTLRALEEGLDNFAGCAVIISHDRHFLNSVCTHMADLDYGELRIYPGANGDYTLYDDDGQSLDYLKTDGSRIRLQWNDAAQTLTIEPMNEAARQIKRTFKLRLQPGGETTSIEYGGTKTTTRPAK